MGRSISAKDYGEFIISYQMVKQESRYIGLCS
jgi:hypothetical protein